jgi:hypothetical protein
VPARLPDHSKENMAKLLPDRLSPQKLTDTQ